MITVCEAHIRGRLALAGWFVVVILFAGNLGLHANALGRGRTLSPRSLPDLPRQRFVAAAEQRSSAARELPSDAEMIAHFQARRQEFGELVRLYQTDKRRVWRYEKGNLQPFETDEYKALLKRAGIRHLSGDGALWLPDPYSSQTAQKARAMDVFHAYAYHGIGLYVENMATSLRVGASVWKEYFYVPVVPMVEKARLWWPRSRHSGDLNRSARVFGSLDDYPAEWLLEPPLRRRECVYRQIEFQWFLSLCHS